MEDFKEEVTKGLNPRQMWQLGPFLLCSRPDGNIALPGGKSVTPIELYKMGFDKKWAVARPGEPKHNYQSNGRCAYCGCTAHA